MRNKPCTCEIVGFVDKCRGENLASFLCTLPRSSVLFKCQNPLLAISRMWCWGWDLVLKFKKGLDDLGNFLQTNSHWQPAQEPDIGQNHTGDCRDWVVENFIKTSVLFGWSKYLQKHLLSQSSYFIKTLCKYLEVFLLLFHVDMEGKERKMWPHVCFQLFISKYLVFLGMKINRVTFKKYAVSLDSSLCLLR